MDIETCHWLVEDNEPIDMGEYGWEYPEEPIVRDCGAEVTHTDRGWTCKNGHGHVYAQVRHDEGWDYAHDTTEAGLLARAGVDSVGMDGLPF